MKSHSLEIVQPHRVLIDILQSTGDPSLIFLTHGFFKGYGPIVTTIKLPFAE